MELYCIRHGQTEANVLRRHAGWDPIELTELGVEQAKKTRQLIQNIRFDHVIVSDLLRTRQTAKLALPEYNHQLDSRIREYGVGSLSGRLVEDCIREDGESYVKMLRDDDFTKYGGECADMVSQRIADFMRELEQKAEGAYKNAKIAAVCHAGAIRHILYYVLRNEPSKEQLHISNCSVSKFGYEGGKWTLHLWNYCGDIE